MTSRRILVLLLVLSLISCAVGGLFIAKLAGAKKQSSIMRITEQDKKLQEAAKVAQTTLPKFLSRLANPESGDKFAIKARFNTPAGSEYLWLKDPVEKNGQFTGILDQKPIAVEARKGDRMTVPQASIYDWLIRRRDGSMAGGFTEIALSSENR